MFSTGMASLGAACAPVPKLSMSSSGWVFGLVDTSWGQYDRQVEIDKRHFLAMRGMGTMMEQGGNQGKNAF